MQPWKTVARTTVLKHSKWLTVENRTIELPDGRRLSEWPWVIMPEYVNVVAVTAEGLFICFRQTKYSVDGVTLAPVGGYLEEGEDPLAAARRELLEETGYESPEWKSLGAYPVDGNHGGGFAHLFLAQQARKIAAPRADDLEEQELLLLERAEVKSALDRGEFKVLSWTAAFAMALLALSPAHSPRIS